MITVLLPGLEMVVYWMEVGNAIFAASD